MEIFFGLPEAQRRRINLMQQNDKKFETDSMK
jgi:hypothetical protein